jgi:ATP-dependent DNA helicase RecG
VKHDEWVAVMGVDLMFRAMLSLGKELPQYETGEDFVRLIIRNGTFDEPFARFVKEQQDKGAEIDLDALIIFSMLRRHKELALPAVAAACQRTAERVTVVLNAMVTKGWLETHGSRKDKRYILSKRLYGILRSAIEYARDKGIDRVKHPQMVLDYLNEKGIITNKDCRSLCGLTRMQARSLFQDLERAGKIEHFGKPPRLKYRLPASAHKDDC